MPSLLEKSVILGDGTTALVADCKSRLAVVVTHPWGPLGGNMHNNVVVAVVLYFRRLGITTVRFNFAGSQIGRGNVQVQQVQFVVESLLTGSRSSSQSDVVSPIDPSNDSSDTKVSIHTEAAGAALSPTNVLLVGYSYGSLIASSASANIPSCIATISIAPPFGVQHWLLVFNAEHHLHQAAMQENMPRLFLIGDRDNFTSVSKFQSIIDERFPSASATGSTGAVIKDADHFFGRREKDVMDVIGEWLLNTFPQCRGDLKKLNDIDFTGSNT